MLPMLNRAGNQLIGRTEDLPTVYPPKDDPASKEAYLGVPTPAGFASIEAFVAQARRRSRSRSSRTTAWCARSAIPRSSASSGSSTTAPYAVDPSARTGSPRLWPADLKHFPADRRKTVLECETKFSTTDIANHLMSFGEYCAMYLAVWCNAVWELEATAPASRRSTSLHAPGRQLPQLWDLHACFDDGVIPRTARPALEKQLKTPEGAR